MVRYKHRFQVALFVIGLVASIFFSFKHERIPALGDIAAATSQEQEDQLAMSAMHAEPAPLASAQPDSQGGIAAITPPTPADLAQVAVLEEILTRHNDNDPRLDTQLRQLSPEAKRLIRSRYATTAPELRNQRGTMVFVMGRDLATPEDVAFLRQVLRESPCLSLRSCATEEKSSGAASDHEHDTASEVTLAYPQLTALKAIESYLGRPESGPLSPALLAELEAARQSRVDKVAGLAERILQDYRAKHPN